MMSSSRTHLCLPLALMAIGATVGALAAVSPQIGNRISGATDAEPNSVPWIVSIGILSDAVYPRHFCGGAIISTRHILTAGHCGDDNKATQLSVRGGITHLHDNDAVVANVTNVIQHPEYVRQTDARSVENDIAILELDRDLKLGDRLDKISLPTSMLKNHQYGSVAGWGMTSGNPIIRPLTLKISDVEYLDDEACRKPVGPHSLCGIQENGNILPGDSGSPFVSQGVVVGIVSSGWGKAHIPDFYTNIYYHRNWIKSVIAGTSSSG